MKVWIVKTVDYGGSGEYYINDVYKSKEAALKEHPDAERSDSFSCVEEWEVKE